MQKWKYSFDRIWYILSAIFIPLLCFSENKTGLLSLSADRLLVSSGTTNPETDCCLDFYRSECTPWTIQIRGSAFLPLKHQLREIYGKAWPALSLESSYRLLGDLYRDGDQLLLWEGIGWATKTGKSIGFGYYTQVDLIPFTAGLEYEIRIVQNFDFYLGLGAAYSLLRIKNYDGFETTHLHRNNWGFVTKTGFRYTCSKHFFIDVFGDYYYTCFGKMNNDPIQTIENHFSSFFVGAAVGTKF